MTGSCRRWDLAKLFVYLRVWGVGAIAIAVDATACGSQRTALSTQFPYTLWSVCPRDCTQVWQQVLWPSSSWASSSPVHNQGPPCSLRKANGSILTSASVAQHRSQRPFLYIACLKMCLRTGSWIVYQSVSCLPIHLEVTAWFLPSPPSRTGYSKHFSASFPPRS